MFLRKQHSAEEDGPIGVYGCDTCGREGVLWAHGTEQPPGLCAIFIRTNSSYECHACWHKRVERSMTAIDAN